MPLKWDGENNPYRYNYFSVLRAGPKVSSRQITALKKNAVKAVKANKAPEIAGKALNEHIINDASAKLFDPHTRLTESLLVHTQPETQQDKLLLVIREQLDKVSLAPNDDRTLELKNEFAVLCWLPKPDPEKIKPPTCLEIDPVLLDNEDDLAHDIVFDC